jgi:hypothetical protein
MQRMRRDALNFTCVIARVIACSDGKHGPRTARHPKQKQLAYFHIQRSSALRAAHSADNKQTMRDSCISERRKLVQL